MKGTKILEQAILDFKRGIQQIEDVKELMLQECEETSKRGQKREAALLDENEKLKKLLDQALSDMDSIKEEALKAQELIHSLTEEKKGLEHALKELKKKDVEKAREKVVVGKYRQPLEKCVYEPKKGFRIKEN